MKFNQNKKIIHVLTAMTVLGFCGLANAQTVQTQGAAPNLVLPQYDSATLQAQGCDPNIMNRLNTDYQARRGLDRQIQGYQAQQLAAAAAAPTSTGNSCYQNALNNIENAAGPFGKLLALFSGGSPDMNAIGNVIGTQLGNLACSQLTSYTSQLSYGLTSSINSTQLGGGYSVGTVGGMVNGAIGSNGTINSGYIGTTVTNQISPTLNSGGGLSGVLGNPFK